MPTSNHPSDAMPETYPMPSFVTLLVRDLAASVRWYRNVLGFEIVFSFTEAGPFPQMAHLRWTKYADLLLRPGTTEGEAGCGVSISFQTPLENVDALAERAAQSGARILTEPGNRPWNTREFSVADLDGYQLSFTGGPVNPHMSFEGITGSSGPT